jgi:hypothetical protein
MASGRKRATNAIVAVFVLAALLIDTPAVILPRPHRQSYWTALMSFLQIRELLP